MPNLYQLPDRARIRSLIHQNACGKKWRVDVDEEIAKILMESNMAKLKMDGYSVRLAAPIVTPKGTWPVVRIETDITSAGSECPWCGGKGGYLEGGDDTSPWVAGCQTCGCVFKFEFKEVGADDETG